jgi:hypothetical protein
MDNRPPSREVLFDSRILIRMSSAMRNDIEVTAAEHSITASQLCRMVIHQWLVQYRGQQVISAIQPEPLRVEVS